MPSDFTLALETIPERDALGNLEDFVLGLWGPFIFDTSSATDEALYEALYSTAEAHGYRAAADAMTARARELGY
jgi:hypothetical protein